MSWLPLAILAALILAASLRPRSRADVAERTQAKKAKKDRKAARNRRGKQTRRGERQRGATTDTATGEARTPTEAAASEPDPFEVLRIQLRLGALAEEVRALERDGNLYARSHHLKATQAAYDALLIEACLLAGIATAIGPDAQPTFPQGEQERFREEVELASRGWSW